jgi:DNA-binding NtrC family response regulator
MASILIVDDEVGIRELLTEILEDEGHDITEASGAIEARLAMQQEQPDVVLLDIWMPDTDGLTLLREWSADGRPSVPIIMMSGHATLDTAIQARRMGAIDVLEKPASIQKVLNAVRQALLVYPPKKRVASTKPKKRIDSEEQEESQQTQSALPLDWFVPRVSSPAPIERLQTAPPPAPLPMIVPSAIAEIDMNRPLRLARDALERAYFLFHLERLNGSMSRLAEFAGLERTHIYRKFKQLGIETIRAKVD